MLVGESWSSGQQSVQQRRLNEARRLADSRVSMWVEICGVVCWVPGERERAGLVKERGGGNQSVHGRWEEED